MGEIGADDAGFSGARESESEVTGSAAEIKDKSIGPIENGMQKSGGARAPEPIELQRQEMVEQIVARGDLRKHFANFAGSIGVGDSAIGTGSLDRCGGFNHGAFVKACYSPLAYARDKQ